MEIYHNIMKYLKYLICVIHDIQYNYAYIATTKFYETPWVVFMGVADEHHGHTHHSNKERRQHQYSMHLSV